MKTTGGKGLHVVFPLTPQADLGHGEGVRPVDRLGDGGRPARPLHRQHGQERPARPHLCRLPAQRHGRDRHRRLLDARARRRAGVGAARLGRARREHPVEPFHPAEPAQAPGVPRPRSVGRALASLKQTLPGAARQRAVEGRARRLLEEGCQAGAGPSRAAATQAGGQRVGQATEGGAQARRRALLDRQRRRPSRPGRDGRRRASGRQCHDRRSRAAGHAGVQRHRRRHGASPAHAPAGRGVGELAQADGRPRAARHGADRARSQRAGGVALQRAARRAPGQRQHRLPLQQAGRHGDRRLLAARPARLPDRRAGRVGTTAARPRAGRLHDRRSRRGLDSTAASEWCSNSECSTRQPSA